MKKNKNKKKKAVKASKSSKSAKKLKAKKKISAPKPRAKKKQNKAVATKAGISSAVRQSGKKGERQSEGMGRLLLKGKERGYVTYDEILKEFPTVEEDIL